MSRTCFHCGETVPPDGTLTVRAGGVDQPVCCRGCEAAASWIQGLGLGDYYRLRTTSADRAEPAGDFSAWDRPAMTRMHVRVHSPGRAEVVVLVDNMRCSACAWLIERALGSEDGVCEVGVSAPARRVRLVFDPRVTPLSSLLQSLAKLGYTPHPLDIAALDALRQRESRDALKRLVVAGLGTMQAMMYAVALYAGHFDGIDPATRDFFRWLGFLVATPVVMYSARPFFAGAWRELRTRQLSMDTPVALAIGLIYAASLFATLTRGGEIYFDSVSMFVLFLLGARYVEMRARHRAGDLVDALARLQPATAERLHGDGDATETVGVHELQPGDRVRVAAGASVPADGIVLDRACHVDESLLTGESTPRSRQPGDTLMAGTLLLDGPVRLRVAQVGADTVLAGIVRMVTRAASDKPALARAADAHARRFVGRTLILTVLTALAWAWFDPTRAFGAAISVLVISCPCAFALAVPAALTRAVAVLARHGVLVVDGDALERLAGADVVVFDKTGTLTEPALDPDHCEVHAGTLDQALAVVAALEQSSTHPLARALRAAAGQLALPAVDQRRDVAGHGVEGVIDGVRYRLGRADWTGHDGDDRLLLTDDNGVVARLAMHEKPRDDAAETLAALRASGAHVAMFSGDSRQRVARIAAALDIGHWRAGASPADKLAWLQAMRREGHVVAMVGDGINDAPVLAGADVAVALGSGAALAQATSGILLAGDRLGQLVRARRIAAAMLRASQQNMRWAIGYNLAAVPLAALGLVPPWLAAIGMSASSLLVVLNALRIGRGEADAARRADHRPAATRGGRVNIILLLIPLSMVLLGAGIWAFFWAVNHAQFDDLDTPALMPLLDDESDTGTVDEDAPS